MTTTTEPTPAPTADTRVASLLMMATYVLGGVGYFLGFQQAASSDAASAIAPVAVLSVGLVGIVSMIRHSVFHRSDAVRMGWDLGRRNNFQIEVGFANLAIGVPALLAVVLDWGTAAQAVLVLAYGLYFAQVAVLSAIDVRTEGRDAIRRMAVMASMAVLLGWFALVALAEIDARPF